MLRLAEPPTGRARLRSSLKSPRNPITPIKTSMVSTLHPGLYKWLREGARRVIGATAKPLYPIDGKAASFDRRNPKTSLFEGGGPPAAVEGVRGRWKESADGGRSPQTMIPPRSPTPHSSCEFGFFFICFLCLVCLLCRGLRRSRPAALPSIAYRGFAVAPMTLRAPSRSLLYSPGCRVETLLVSKGVMGFLGDLRGRNRNLPLIP